MGWLKTSNTMPRKYHCGYCGTRVSSQEGYLESDNKDRIYICPCGKPTFFDELTHSQVPGYAFGNAVHDVPEDLGRLYEEARRCTTAQAHTSAVLACRKLLMHIAVEKGAEKGKSFIEYIDYLYSNHYVPPDGKGRVDHIKQKGNEATHEILLMGKEDAEDLVNFTEMLLRLVYEFPAVIDAKRKAKE